MSGIEIIKPNERQIKSFNIEEWSPWECNPSSFDWEYESEEWCYLFEGKAKINTAEGEVSIQKGDLVKFPKGLKCRWDVLERVRKVYTFK